HPISLRWDRIRRHVWRMSAACRGNSTVLVTESGDGSAKKRIKSHVIKSRGGDRRARHRAEFSRRDTAGGGIHHYGITAGQAAANAEIRRHIRGARQP